MKTLTWENSPFPFKYAKEGALILLSSFFLSLFANVSVFLPFTPVPIAIQSHIALLLGALLGPKRGALSVMAFLAQGALGFPVFAGGQAGFAVLLGPRGGYLLGYVVGAYLVGLLIQKMKELSLSKLVLAFSLGSLAVYVFGTAYLSSFVGFQKALLLGVLPFLLGDVLKTTVAVKAAEVFFRRKGR